MKKILFFLLITTLWSCKRQNDISPSANNTPANGGKLQTRSAADGTWDLLGYGLDVTGDMLNPSSISDAPVFDMTRFAADYRSKLDVGNTGSGVNQYYGGATAFDYMKDVSKSKSFDISANTPKVEGGQPTGTPTLFTGSFSKSSSDQNKTTYSNSYSYATYEVNHPIRRIRFTGDATMTLLMQYLTPDFLNNVATKSADELVDRYGTHVMLDITIGGRLRFDYSGSVQNETDYVKKTSDVKMGLGFSLAKIIGININTDKSSTEIAQATTNTSKKEYTARYYGGTNSGTSISIDKDGNTSQNINIAGWEQSVNANNAALIDVGKALYLYDFITDPAKKAQVKAVIDKRIQDSQIVLTPDAAPVYGYYNQPLNVWRYEFNIDNIDYLHQKDWQSKGIAFYAFKEHAPGTVPVYEFYAPTTKDCYWNQGNLTSTYWQFGGVKFYAYPTRQEGTVPVYGYYHQKSGRSHCMGEDPGVPKPINEWTNLGVLFYAK